MYIWWLLQERYSIVEDIQDFERIIQQNTQGLDPIFFKAPVLLIAHVPVEDSFGRDDATYAAYNLILAAQRMGLGSCLIGYFIYALENSDQLKKHLNHISKTKITLSSSTVSSSN